AALAEHGGLVVLFDDAAGDGAGERAVGLQVVDVEHLLALAVGAVHVVVALVAVEESGLDGAAAGDGWRAGAVDLGALSVGHGAGFELLLGGALVVEVARVFVDLIHENVAGGALAELLGAVG